MYTVKSGYQVALKLKYPNIPITLEDSFYYWKAIWGLDLPEKIKISYEGQLKICCQQVRTCGKRR